MCCFAYIKWTYKLNTTSCLWQIKTPKSKSKQCKNLVSLLLLLSPSLLHCLLLACSPPSYPIFLFVILHLLLRCSNFWPNQFESKVTKNTEKTTRKKQNKNQKSQSDLFAIPGSGGESKRIANLLPIWNGFTSNGDLIVCAYVGPFCNRIELPGPFYLYARNNREILHCAVNRERVSYRFSKSKGWIFVVEHLVILGYWRFCPFLLLSSESAWLHFIFFSISSELSTLYSFVIKIEHRSEYISKIAQKVLEERST